MHLFLAYMLETRHMIFVLSRMATSIKCLSGFGTNGDGGVSRPHESRCLTVDTPYQLRHQIWAGCRHPPEALIESSSEMCGKV
jgi:hypothetical protein